MNRLRPRPLIHDISTGCIEPLSHTATRMCGEAVWSDEITNPPTAAEWLARLRRSGRSYRTWGRHRMMKWPPRPWIRPPDSLSHAWRCWCDPDRLP